MIAIFLKFMMMRFRAPAGCCSCYAHELKKVPDGPLPIREGRSARLPEPFAGDAMRAKFGLSGTADYTR